MRSLLRLPPRPRPLGGDPALPPLDHPPRGSGSPSTERDSPVPWASVSQMQNQAPWDSLGPLGPLCGPHFSQERSLGSVLRTTPPCPPAAPAHTQLGPLQARVFPASALYTLHMPVKTTTLSQGQRPPWGACCMHALCSVLHSHRGDESHRA